MSIRTLLRVLGLSALLGGCGDEPSSGPGRDVALTIDEEESVAEIDPRFLSVAIDAAQVADAAACR